MALQRQLKEQQARHFSSQASKNDQDFREQSKYYFDKKDEKFRTAIQNITKSRTEHLNKLSEDQQRKIFQANQRRRMKDSKKNQSLELARIKFQSIEGTSELKASIANQRGYMLHQIVVGKLGQPGQNTSIELNKTPGEKISLNHF